MAYLSLRLHLHANVMSFVYFELVIFFVPFCSADRHRWASLKRHLRIDVRVCMHILIYARKKNFSDNCRISCKEEEGLLQIYTRPTVTELFTNRAVTFIISVLPI